jgi:hypothetical protein
LTTMSQHSARQRNVGTVATLSSLFESTVLRAVKQSAAQNRMRGTRNACILDIYRYTGCRCLGKKF